MNIIPRTYKKKLNGDLWLITCYFNPVKYSNKKEIFTKFYNNIKLQGAKLVIVELASSIEDCELAGIVRSDDIYVQNIKTLHDNIWQKERLLNLALTKLPDSCDKVMWIDCDILFPDNDWISKTIDLLNKYVVVQPMEYCVKLSKRGIFKNIDSTPFAHEYELQTSKNNSWIAAHLKYGEVSLKGNRIETWGHPGFCCAFRRTILENGLFDKRPDCSSDMLIVHACLGKHKNVDKILSSGIEQIYNEWASQLYKKILYSINYIKNGIIFHIYHGSYKDRKYNEQNQIIMKNKFSYNKDIVSYKDPDSILEWSELAPIELRSYMNSYFTERKENG